MRALVLSGGGAKGAYQVGAVKYLLGECGQHYDIITGTSVGALNGSFLAMFPAGQELTAANELRRMWMRINTDSIYRKWYRGVFGILPAILPWWLGGKNSLYTTKPLRKLIDKYLRPDAIKSNGKILRVGAVAIGSGERRVWGEGDGDALKKAVAASAAFPVAFEAIKIDGTLYIDDGVRETTPVEDAIKAGATHIDIITLSPDGVTGETTNKVSAIDVAVRALDAAMSEIERWDIKVADLYNALAASGHPSGAGKSQIVVRVLRPKMVLLENSLDFSRAKIRANIDRGYHDARDAGWV